MALSPPPDHWLPGFNFNVEEWDAAGLHYETLAICRSLAAARTAFAAAIEEKPASSSERQIASLLILLRSVDAPLTEQRISLCASAGEPRLLGCARYRRTL
jgi:hypothetical protein